MIRPRYVVERIPQQETTQPSLIGRKREFKARSQQVENPRFKITWAKVENQFEIPHINDLEQEVIEAQWFTADEMKEIKDSVKETARIMSLDGKQIIEDDDEEFCFRGLEYRTKQGRRKRYDNKTRAWEAVQDEQHLKGTGGDVTSISFSCTLQTHEPRQEAIERAKADEECIQEYLGNIRLLFSMRK
jgi:hypothetical protein